MAVLSDTLGLVGTMRSRREWLSGNLRQVLNLLPTVVLVAEDQACRSMFANEAGDLLFYRPKAGNAAKTAAKVPRRFKAFTADGVSIADGDLPVQRAARGEAVTGCEFELRFDDGGRTWLYGNAEPLCDGSGSIWGAVGAFQDISERKRAENQSAELVAMKRLQWLATQVVDTDDLEMPLNAVLDAAMDILNADFGNIQLYDAATGSLRIAAQRGFDRRYLDFFAEVGADDGSACGMALRTNRQVLIEDVEEDATFAPSLDEARAAGFRSVQSKPLISSSGQFVGVLSTHFRQPRTFSEHQLALMDICARQAADAIHSHVLGQLVRASEARLRSEAEELRSAKAEAERSVLARSKFLAAASHDLRQPVQSLTLLLAALKPHATAPVVAKAVGLMELNGLLSSLLDISRLDAGVVTPQMASVDIGTLLDRLATEYAMLAASKGLRLRAVGRRVMVRTDPDLVDRVIRNLIENAIRYTDTGGIVLGVRITGDLARIEVVDSGIGIPAEKLPDIFEEFFQVGNPGRDRNKGLGLGLAIVRRIARLLGAEMRVFSNEGRGTRFSVLLPLAEKAEQANSPDACAEAMAARILVIEDDLTVRTGLELLLRGWGHEVVTVASGEDALDLCARADWQVDAVVADYRLGAGLTGIDAAKEIIHRADRMIPVLVVTGDTEPARVSEVHASGFTILHKPVAADELRATLARLLRGGASEAAVDLEGTTTA